MRNRSKILTGIHVGLESLSNLVDFFPHLSLIIPVELRNFFSWDHVLMIIVFQFHINELSAHAGIKDLAEVSEGQVALVA